MSFVIQRESTEYLYVGVTGDLPSEGAEMAFLPAGVRPLETDWLTATLIDSASPLYQDAQASVPGDYWLAILVGPYNGNVLESGDYQVWVRLTDLIERPVRITPVALEVA
jgi:hypothetical protein